MLCTDYYDTYFHSHTLGLACLYPKWTATIQSSNRSGAGSVFGTAAAGTRFGLLKPPAAIFTGSERGKIASLVLTDKKGGLP